ncbi:MAG: transposase [Elusimicrobia bacterium]|nr:transposase [Elusimicrobiota bacterium]
MSRPLRLEYPGAFYHVLARGNERKEVFRDDEDKSRFLNFLGEASDRWALSVHAYALMVNHYHILLETKAGMLSLPMRHVNGVYTQFFNRKHNRVGHLFQGRFKALLIDKESYLLTLSRYIHQNPIRAGMAKSAGDYPWSSYPAYLGLTRTPKWLNTQETLSEFGQSLNSQRKNYRAFIETDNPADPFKNVIGQLVLGSRQFLQSAKERISRLGKSNKEHPCRRVLVLNLPPERVVREVCQVFGVNYESLVGGRCRDMARPAAMLYLRDKSRLTLKEIARMFNVDYTAVSWNIKKICQTSGDVGLKAKLNDLELRFSDANS